MRCQVDHPCDYYGALSDHLITYTAGQRSPQKHLLSRVRAGSVYIYQSIEVVIGPFAIGDKMTIFNAELIAPEEPLGDSDSPLCVESYLPYKLLDQLKVAILQPSSSSWA